MKNEDKKLGSSYTIIAALLLCITSFCPFDIQDAVAIVTACVLGLQGAGAVGLYIVIGMARIPVLPGHSGGTGILTGSQGGFIWGIFFAALMCGLLMGNVLKKKKPVGLLERAEAEAKAGKIQWFYLIKLFLVMAASFVVVQTPGVFWYATVVSRENLEAGKLALTYGDAFNICTKPQIPMLLIKLAVSYPLVLILRKLFEPKRG